MALSVIDGISVAGVVSCVPQNKVDNLSSSILGSIEDAERFVKNTGIRFRRIVDSGVCTSDLCEKAANQLLSGLNWERDEISVVIVVSQTPDYIVPNTAILLQNRLGLKKTCLAFDIPLGCSGYVYGLSVMASILKSNNFKKGLLMVGDTLSRQASPYDKSAYPLFGDAATATAVENTNDINHKINFLLGSDGEGYESIIVPGGGYREPLTVSSLEYVTYDDGNKRNRANTIMIGTDVFSFGISVIPAEIKMFFNHFNCNPESFDYAFFHQANKFMNEKIRKKVGFTEQQVPYSLQDYGNTSSATIPLTISHLFGYGDSDATNKNVLLCGFGVGLSWGICSFNTNNIFAPKIIEF